MHDPHAGDLAPAPPAADENRIVPISPAKWWFNTDISPVGGGFLLIKERLNLSVHARNY